MLGIMLSHVEDMLAMVTTVTAQKAANRSLVYIPFWAALATCIVDADASPTSHGAGFKSLGLLAVQPIICRLGALVAPDSSLGLLPLDQWCAAHAGAMQTVSQIT